MTHLRLSQQRDPIARVRELVDNLNRISDPSSEIDVSQVRYITPLTILPLAIRIDGFRAPVADLKSNDIRPLEHLKSIEFPHGRAVDFSDRSPQASLVGPIIKIATDGRCNSNPVVNLNAIAQELTSHVIEYLRARGEIASNYEEAIPYFLSEICDNIHEHAEAMNCWIYFRFWKPRGELEFCIADDGIGIKRRYDKSGFGVQNHVDALEQAIRGHSTKSDLRGFGIGSTIRMFTSTDARGEVTIISGNAAYLKTHCSEAKLGQIPVTWKGVILSVRLTRPLSRISAVNYVSG